MKDELNCLVCELQDAIDRWKNLRVDTPLDANFRDSTVYELEKAYGAIYRKLTLY